MENPFLEFVRSLGEFADTEYGDFKREVDAQLRKLVESSPSLNESQTRELSLLRQEYLWHDHDDNEIEGIKKNLRQRVLEISELH